MVRTVRKGLKGYLEDVSTDYTFTGDVENTVADVDVKYGSHFTAETAYSYEYGKKTNMVLSVSHGQSARPYETEYTYDAIGRLSGKERAMTGTGKSLCSYTYDVHGWLTGINSGGFQEQLYYTDGLDGGYYNGNISTVKWKRGDYGPYQGYNLKYDGSNRLTSAVFGEGDNLTSYKNYYDEYAEYDCNGNITRMNRRGLVDNMHGGFGFVDNLRMTYEGNMLTSVRDNATRQSYAGAADFDGVTGQEYPLTYNGAGSLVSDAGRGIARIGYDPRNNPVRIQFTDGNVTKYVYSATGEKLRVVYQTAVPNVSVAIGSARELSPSEILSADSVDYLLGGRLTLRNGRIDRFQFDEGYCQAKRYTYNHSQDDFIFYYYDRDHLGNIRQVVKGSVSNTGNVVQSMDYYPFGAQFCDGSTDNNFQSRRYNGKEFDKMHGLNTYDYGARQYNPVTARWDRVDPLCEKYYSVSPYVYCMNNPIRFIDPDGLEWKDIHGNIIINHDEIKVYIFYDKSAFSKQSQAMYWDAERTYGKGSVALSDAMTTDSFGEDWKNMASNNIAEVNLNYHGNNQTLFLNASKGEYLTATGNGFTNTQPQSRRTVADNVQDLSIPIGNISHAQLNINSCKSNSTNQKPLLGSGKTLMKVFAESFNFQAVRGTSVGVSYSRHPFIYGISAVKIQVTLSR